MPQLTAKDSRRRHGVVAFTAMAMALAYADRVNLAVASVAMRAEFGWSQATKGLVLASFFVGLIGFQIISAGLAQRFGGKRVLGCAVAAWSAITLLTPWAAATGLRALIGARVALGIGESVVMPASYELFSRWIPAGERGRAIGRFLGGIPLGQVGGFAATGYLTIRMGWPASFYCFGALGLVWALVFSRLVQNNPLTDTRMTLSERALLPGAPAAPARLPYRVLFRKPAVVGFMCAHFCHNWALYILVSWLPSYFSEQLGMTVGRASLYSALSWAANLLALLIGGAGGDWLIARGTAALRVRRGYAVAGLAGTAACLYLLRGVAAPEQALLLVCAATFCLGVAAAGFTSVPLDLVPRHAPLLVGVSNTFASLPGVVGVAFTGWLLDATHTYAAVFVVTALVALLGAAALACVVVPIAGGEGEA